MEKCQKEHIEKNIVELIKNTICDAELISHLTAAKALAKCDESTLEIPGLTPFEKSKKLYEILLTRTGSFNILKQSLHCTNQTGALQILNDTRNELRNYENISYDQNCVLGNGCFGTKVYRGEFGGRNVAVKIANTNFIKRETIVGEIDLLLKLEGHENIVRYITAKQNDNCIYIVLELCFINLQDEMKMKLVNMNPIILLQKCTVGISYLHSKNVIHRDMKPANILINCPDQVKIADFGLSKQIPIGATEVSIQSGAVGTAEWMAPEILESTTHEASDGQKSLKMSAASDMFSLGCIFYFVLTNGIHPFGKDAVERQYNIRCYEPQIIISIFDESWSSLIRSMISKNVKKRPAALDVLSHPCFSGNLKNIRVDLKKYSSRGNIQVFPNYISSATALIASFNFGIVLGWSSPALLSLVHRDGFRIVIVNYQWIASLVTVGGVFGSVMTGHFIEKLECRFLLLLSAAPLVLGWLSMSFVAQVYLLYIGRFLTGFGAGLLGLILPVNLSEITEPEIRNYLCGMHELAINFGIFFAFILGSAVPVNHMSRICCIFSIIFAIFVRYSNRQRKSQTENETKCQVLQGVTVIKGSNSERQKLAAGFEEIVKSATLMPLSQYLMFVLINQLSVRTAIFIYTAPILEHNDTFWSPYLSGAFAGAFLVLSTIMVFFVMKRTGRKPLLIASLFLIFMSLIILGYCFDPTENSRRSYDAAKWIPAAFLAVYNAAYCAGISGLIWTVMRGLLSRNTIRFTYGFGNTVNWILAFLTIRFFYYLVESMGPRHTFWLLALICLFGVTFTNNFIPKTKREPLAI